ncbi:MAG: hypothetical protein K8S97_08100 [Anaerolineae bacterium]|nr:hypothetical protein [Anaerolineae bacterium]
MHFNFLTPEVWNGLVIGVILIGFALAILRLISDRDAYQRQQRRAAHQAENSAGQPSAEHPTHHNAQHDVTHTD